MDNKKIKIIGLFPTPVYRSNLNREFNKKEKLFFEDSFKNLRDNTGNIMSLDSYILENKILSKLKNELHVILKDYFDKIVQPSDNVTPHITQSWLNLTEKNQYHHQHTHSNSIVSGVIYIKASKDEINFHSQRYNNLSFNRKEYNEFNSELWSLPVNTGDIILFPSSLSHSVPVKQTEDLRISLSFNTFVKGVLGDIHHKTELKINE